MSGRMLNGSATGRSAARLADGLEKSVSAYAVAASAAGVSLLALSAPAHARIVYTPANVTIAINGGCIPVDLNHDGIADFCFSNSQTGFADSHPQCLRVQANGSANEVWGRGNWQSFRPGVFASALRAGFKVRSNKSYFQKGTSDFWLMGFFGVASSSTASYGQWWFTQHRYLGLKFVINGDIHYGWARLDVPSPGSAATLTGYAYETIPNKPIITDKTKGPDVITLEPASLGRLAQGASGISAWREKK